MHTKLVIIVVLDSIRCWSSAIELSPDEKCVPLEECSQALQLVNTKKFHFGAMNLLFLLDSFCPDKDDQIYLRCISPVKMEEFLNKADLLPDQRNCGFANATNKIADAEDANLGEFPWIALLRYLNATGNVQYGCHANLISKKYLVTVAHCIDTSSFKSKNDVNTLGKIYSVILGEYDTQSQTDCEDMNVSHPDCKDMPKEYLIESYLIHPDFNAVNRKSDIALIRLQTDVEFSDLIKPICLPPINTYLYHNEEWWIAGWGPVASGILNKRTQRATFWYHETNTCENISTKINPNILCAGSKSTARTCPGDSGSPLMQLNPIGEHYRTFLIGVTSRGSIDCLRPHKTIFTKTSPYVEWIIESLKN